MTPQVITSAIGLSIPPSATTNTIIPAAATVVVALPNNSNGCSGIQSYQSFPLLSELPLTIMLLFQLYPIKLASKANMSNLIPAMMAFLQNQSLLTSSPSTSSSSSLKTPSALGGAMTPSLSTPLAVVASSSSGKGHSSTSGKTSANVESSSTQVAGHGKF